MFRLIFSGEATHTNRGTLWLTKFHQNASTAAPVKANVLQEQSAKQTASGRLIRKAASAAERALLYALSQQFQKNKLKLHRFCGRFCKRPDAEQFFFFKLFMRSQNKMKFLPALFFLAFCPALFFPQEYPEIPQLKSNDCLFSQYQQEVQDSSKELARSNFSVANFFTYTAQEGDTVLSLAARCSILYETLATANSIGESAEPLAGKKLILPTANGLFVPEIPQTSAELLLANEYKSKTAQGTYMLYTIGGRKFYFLHGVRFSPAQRAYFLNPGMSMPLENSILTSAFGKRQSPVTGKWHLHKGIDLAAPRGTSVLACKGGTVQSAEYGNRVYGNCIVIRHSGGMESLYAHLDEIAVKKEDAVSSGQKIGTVGMTGLTTGPHLHFEIKQNGSPLNPREYLKKR